MNGQPETHTNINPGSKHAHTAVVPVWLPTANSTACFRDWFKDNVSMKMAHGISPLDLHSKAF